jgi:hypothetical protein
MWQLQAFLIERHKNIKKAGIAEEANPLSVFPARCP